MGHRFPEIDVGEDSQFVWVPIRPGWPPSTISRSTSASSTARTSPPSRRTAPGGDRIRSRRSAEILGEDWEADGPVATAMPPQPAADGARVEPRPLPARRRSATSSPAWSTRTRSASLTWSATSATSTRTRRCCCTTAVRIRISSTASSRPIATGPCCILRRGRCGGDGCTTSRWTACDSPWFISRSIRSRSSIPTSSRCGRDTRTGWAALLAEEPGVGIPSNSPELQGPGTSIQPGPGGARRDRPLAALPPALPRRGIEIRPLGLLALDRLHGRRGARPRPALRRGRRSSADPPGDKVWATEEVVLPTLVALWAIASRPTRAATTSCDTGRLRVQQLEAAMDRPDVFWAHPIPRRYEDPLRRHVRGRYGDYAAPRRRRAEQARRRRRRPRRPSC